MKQIVLIIVFATSLVACASGDNPITPPDITQIRIKENPGETLKYVGRIGNDFDTALDSLRKLKSIPSDITKEPLEVLFDYDDRLFFGIIYGDCGMYSDVLDTKGFYYLRSWYSKPEGIYSHLRFIKRNVIDNRYSFDISGRKLNISPSKGLYIQGGKKVLVK